MISQDKYLCGDPTSIKPRITIPIEPDLETARRAQRTMFVQLALAVYILKWSFYRSTFILLSAI